MEETLVQEEIKDEIEDLSQLNPIQNRLVILRLFCGTVDPNPLSCVQLLGMPFGTVTTVERGVPITPITIRASKRSPRFSL